MRSRVPSVIGILQVLLHLLSIGAACAAIVGLIWTSKEVVYRKTAEYVWAAYIACIWIIFLSTFDVIGLLDTREKSRRCGRTAPPCLACLHFGAVAWGIPGLIFFLFIGYGFEYGSEQPDGTPWTPETRAKAEGELSGPWASIPFLSMLICIPTQFLLGILSCCYMCRACYRSEKAERARIRQLLENAQATVQAREASTTEPQRPHEGEQAKGVVVMNDDH